MLGNMGLTVGPRRGDLDLQIRSRTGRDIGTRQVGPGGPGARAIERISH